MSIWEYRDKAKYINTDIFTSTRCIYCRYRLNLLPQNYDERYDKRKLFSLPPDEIITQVAVCPICGWWKLHRVIADSEYWEPYYETESSVRIHSEYGAIGSLKELDLSNVVQPIHEVRTYLSAKYTKRFNVNPRVFEETVASVFNNLGYTARVTAYSGDEGIDVVLDGPDETVIGVQVKRYKNSIQVEQIRSFAGALFLGDYTAGIFVTTSKYQPGSYNAATLSGIRGKPVELMDARRFYDALQIAQRNRFEASDRDAPFNEIPTSELIGI